MRVLYERQAQLEIEIHDFESDLIAGFEDEAARKPARSRDHFRNVPHACDGCGRATPDVDLWAEDHDTGEELWLCTECGELVSCAGGYTPPGRSDDRPGVTPAERM